MIADDLLPVEIEAIERAAAAIERLTHECPKVQTRYRALGERLAPGILTPEILRETVRYHLHGLSRSEQLVDFVLSRLTIGIGTELVRYRTWASECGATP